LEKRIENGESEKGKALPGVSKSNNTKKNMQEDAYSIMIYDPLIALSTLP
jgi:hypothetical protein